MGAPRPVDPGQCAAPADGAGPADPDDGAAGIRIRRATLEDLEYLLAIEQASFASDRLSRRSFRKLIGSASAVLLVAESPRSEDAEDATTDPRCGYALLLFRAGTGLARLRATTGLQEALARHGLLQAAIDQSGDGQPRFVGQDRHLAAGTGACSDGLSRPDASLGGEYVPGIPSFITEARRIHSNP